MKNKVSVIIVSVLFLLFGAYIIYSRYQLTHNFKITVAYIYDVQVSGYKNSGDYSILYNFSVDGKQYKNNNDYDYCGDLNLHKIRSLLQCKAVPIVYGVNVHSFGLGKLLITQKDAKQFHFTLPDSLMRYDSLLTCK